MQTKTEAAPARRATLSIAAKPTASGAIAEEAYGQPPAPPATTANSEAKRLSTEPKTKAAGLATASTQVPTEPGPFAPASWSSEDESAYQALLAQRKAAGYRQRGRDVAGQCVCVGEITPNPNTVAAAIVGLVAEHNTLTRGELLAAMAKASFPHTKARPEDRGWCQGYVAGALRDGFLALSNENSLRAKSADGSQ